jgi:hypothetical protein
MFYNNITPTTGISIYTTAVTSNFGSNLEKPQIDFITTGGTNNYRGVSYQYLVTHLTLPTTRMGVLQGLWSTGGTSNISSSDTGPLQIDNGSSGVVYSLGFSAVTGGISVYLYAQGDGSPYTFKAYKVLL